MISYERIKASVEPLKRERHEHLLLCPICLREGQQIDISRSDPDITVTLALCPQHLAAQDKVNQE